MQPDGIAFGEDAQEFEEFQPVVAHGFHGAEQHAAVQAAVALLDVRAAGLAGPAAFKKIQFRRQRRLCCFRGEHQHEQGNDWHHAVP